VFEVMHGFDESHHALEDVELGYRMHLAGYRIRLDRDLQFTHLKRYTLYSLMRSDLLYRAIPWTRLMRRMRIVRNDLNTRTSQVASVAVALLIPVTVLLAPLTWPSPWPLLLTAALAVCYAALNWHFLSYVRRLRGAAFALRTLAMHWWFHVYSAAGLAIGLATSERAAAAPKA
jgi:hypothetical protein